MQAFINLIFFGLLGIGISAYAVFDVTNKNISFATIAGANLLFLYVVFTLARKDLKDKHEDMVKDITKKYTLTIGRLRKDHDTTTLEKTIRDGTRTLIQNALDYFKIENIKNEMGPSAAIQNLQLDKYGQIIELLADFSLILPDHVENQKIVQQEIIHQIEIYRMDERSFSRFLERIMVKYKATVKKKMREREDEQIHIHMNTCPQCAEKVFPRLEICNHCGYELKKSLSNAHKKNERKWLKEGYDLYHMGNYDKAIRLFTLAIDVNPKADHAYYCRGIIFHKLNNYAQALDDLKAAAKFGNQKAKAVLNTINPISNP